MSVVDGVSVEGEGERAEGERVERRSYSAPTILLSA